MSSGWRSIICMTMMMGGVLGNHKGSRQWTGARCTDNPIDIMQDTYCGNQPNGDPIIEPDVWRFWSQRWQVIQPIRNLRYMSKKVQRRLPSAPWYWSRFRRAQYSQSLVFFSRYPRTNDSEQSEPWRRPAYLYLQYEDNGSWWLFLWRQNVPPITATGAEDYL